MAGNIKGITIEFRGDTTKLDSALRKINTETRSLDKELRNVDKALKFNPTNIELWRQKQSLLAQKVDETKEKLRLLKQAQDKMDADGVDKTSAEYQKLQREIIETESKVKTFEGQLRQVGNVKLRATSEQIKQMGNKLSAAGEAMQGLSAAGAALVGSLGAMAVKSGRVADDLNTLAKVSGIGTEDLQKYAATADLVDVSVDAIAKSNKRLTKSMYSAQNGSKTQAEAFEKLGVSVTNSDGSLRDSDAVFQDVVSALGSMKNETERDALAMTLMGKSASELNPLIEDGGETYKNVSDTLKKYNLDFVDQKTLDAANQFNDQLDTMKVIGTVALQSIGAQLAGYLAPALEKFVDFVGQLAQWLSGLSPQVLTVIGIIGTVLAVLAPLLMILGKLAFAISSIMTLAGTVGPVLAGLAGPIGIAIAIIAALIAVGVLLYKNWDTVKAKAKAFKDAVVSTFNQFKASVTKTFNSIKDAIIKPIQTAIDKVKSIVNKIKGLFPIKVGNIFGHIKLPHFDWHWKKVVGSLKIPVFDGIDWYAKGGIFDSPTIAGIGESGPEAVVPLDKLWKHLDNANSGAVTINVYGAEGQSPKQIAEEVERILIRRAKNQRLAW